MYTRSLEISSEYFFVLGKGSVLTKRTNKAPAMQVLEIDTFGVEDTM